MSSISLIDFARAVQAKTVFEMAKKAGLGAPPPAISVRALIQLLGDPLQPTQLGLFWDTNAAGEIVYHPADDQSVPVDKTIQFTWSDPGSSSIRKATHCLIEIKVAATAQDVDRQDVTRPGSYGIAGLKPSTQYLWTVVPSNNIGTGPSSPAFVFRTLTLAPPPEPPPTISVTYTRPPDKAQFDVKGTGFLPNSVVHVRGTNDSDGTSAFQDTNSDKFGAIELKTTIPCEPGTRLSFSAEDGRPNPADVTGTLWSNTVTIQVS